MLENKNAIYVGVIYCKIGITLWGQEFKTEETGFVCIM